MRVLVATTAGAGHFGPLVPFADACRRAGHDVLVAAPNSFAASIERAGFPFWPCADLPEEEWGAVMSRLPSLPPEEAEALVIGEVFARLDARSTLPRMLEAIDEWRPDLVMREEAEFGSYVAAEARGVPQVRIAIGMADFADFGLALATPALAELRTSVGLSEDWQGDRIRRTPALTLVPASLEDPSAPGSPQILRFRSGSEEAPAPLPDWWPGQEGPLVYVTFGSVAGTIPSFVAVLPAVVEGLAHLPLRLLVTVGEGFDPAQLEPAPPNVHVERWVPQGDVLPHADAIVCHGGFGTVLGALAHGVPLVVVPLFADQPANARRVAAIGAGLAVDGGPSLHMEVVRDSVSRVLSDPSYRAAAERVAAEMQALPPVDEAVEALVRIAGA